MGSSYIENAWGLSVGCLRERRCDRQDATRVHVWTKTGTLAFAFRRWRIFWDRDTWREPKPREILNFFISRALPFPLMR